MIVFKEKANSGTTLTELIAIAAPAIIGLSIQPVQKENRCDRDSDLKATPCQSGAS